MIRLRYGNTNTFLIPCAGGYLLIDTDYAGTLPLFYKALKQSGIQVREIVYVLATHYHPDHCGLIGELQKQGIRLLLPDTQVGATHFSDAIFQRDRIPYTPVDETQAIAIPCVGSRNFLEGIGIAGEIISTPSHSVDSVSLILDNGDCFVGDLEPYEFVAAYDANPALSADWEAITKFHPKRILYAHANMKELERDE